MSGAGRIPLARPRIAPAAESAVLDVLRSGHLVRGARVEAFERRLAQVLGVPYVVAVSSGTAALHLALAAAGVGAGDEVVLPDLTFPSVANVVQHLGGVPVTVDVSMDTFNAAPAALLAAMTDRTRAVIAVDQFGLPTEMEELRAAEAAAKGDDAGAGKRQPWTLIEDAACALGAARDGFPCGAGATLGCLSFHPRKLVTTGEGGAVATRSEALHDRVLRLSNHGLTRGADGQSAFVDAGWNYRMSDVHAAVGAGQIESLADEIAERRSLVGEYVEALVSSPGVVVPKAYSDPRHGCQSFVLLLPEEVDRRDFLVGMRERGVEATIGSYAIHQQPQYREAFPRLAERPRPHSAAIAARSVALPLFSGLTEESQKRVVRSVLDVLNSCRSAPRPRGRR